MIDRYQEHPNPRTSERLLSAPSCVQCGMKLSTSDRGELAEGICPDCGCDFRTREPMSYARMEGFLDTDIVEVPQLEPNSYRESWSTALETRVTERWILTIFLGLVTTLLIMEIALG